MWDVLVEWWEEVFGDDDLDAELGADSAAYERNHEAMWLSDLDEGGSYGASEGD
jgi:hypothetical protein